MSSTDRWERIETFFSEASELPITERDAFLSAACRTPDGAPDTALREEVEALLAVEPGAQDYFLSAEDQLARVAGKIVDDETSDTPERVGPWRLDREIGRGGMGTVYLAHRDDGRFEQTAAVKLVRPGLADDLVQRFRAERQILARLDHPSIARLLDGGKTDDGRPYLVMEYVDGETITDYCDRRRLGVNERLALFESVCEAVQFAHGRLVVHRDLKPSNVMVAEGDGTEARVKLLDFGIAKLLDADGASMQTRTEHRVMTPEYAAPEQVRGEAITTATDVYALGVLLYELLTGTRPHAEARGRHAVAQAILETEPVQPSDAVTRRAPTGGRVPPDPAAEQSPDVRASAADASETGRLRATTTERLRKRLRGDLDQIVLKALRKEPERRYNGASVLSDDVRRHLDGLPVEAQPESVRYRAGKFVRRHRGAVAAAVVALVAVIGGAGVALWQATEARAAQARAETEATRATETTDFLVDLFEATTPEEAKGDTVTAFAVLERGAARIATDLERQPDLRSDLQRTIGRVYVRLGLFDQADSLLSASVQPGAASRARTLFWQSDLAYERGDTQAADSLLRLTLAFQKTAVRQGTLDPADPSIARALDSLGSMVARGSRGDSDDQEGRYTDSRRLHEAALARRRASGDSIGVAESLHNMGVLSYGSGERTGSVELLRAAAPLFRQAFALRMRLLGPRHPKTNLTRANYGLLLSSLGETTDAERLLQQAVDVERAVSGPRHVRVASRLYQLSFAHIDRGDFRGAEELLAEAADILSTSGGTQGSDGLRRSLGYRINAADLARRDGRAAEAARRMGDLAAESERTRGAESRYTRLARRQWSAALIEADRPGEAIPILRPLVAQAKPGPERAIVRRDLGRALAATGRRTEARTLLQTARDSLAVEFLAVDPDLRHEFEVAEAALARVSAQR